MMEYWQDIKNNPSKMKCVFDYVISSIEDMKLTNEKAYWKARLGLHESMYGCHFDSTLAHYAVSKMENVDGTWGEHWTSDQTKSLLTGNKLDINEWDFYYLMNMLYSDYQEILGADANNYVKMSIAYVDDPDADKGKVFRIWKSRYI